MFNEGINPITVRGKNLPEEGSGERNLTIGRVWISSVGAPEGQHRFDPHKRTQPLDKIVQILIYEGSGVTEKDVKVLALSLHDENDFVVKMKEMLKGKKDHFVSQGSVTREGAGRRTLFFQKAGDSLMVSALDSSLNQLSVVFVEFSLLRDALGFLFNKGELE